jgi:hypothetical protein
LYVPAAHCSSLVAPSPQKKPGRQARPVVLSIGVGVEAPRKQMKPGSHGSDELAAATPPRLAQYWPAGHGRHAELL